MTKPVKTIAPAKRGDLLLCPGTISAVASMAAASAGTAQSYRKTVWNFAVVTSVGRDGMAKAHESYRPWSDAPVAFKGEVVGQMVAAASMLAPLDVRAFVMTHRDDYASADDARAAVRAAVEAAKREAAAQPPRYMAPDGRLYVCGTGPAALAREA